MPSEIEIYGDIVLFGIRVTFRSNDERALDAALSIYPEWKSEPTSQADVSIYIVLVAYDVNHFGEDVHQVEGELLSIRRNGISVQADGLARSGSCAFNRQFDAEQFVDLVNTVVLFLVGHAGRVPLHASAVMVDGTAIMFAGVSGAGKSSLALAADQAGLPVLSDDTIYVQTDPCLRIWSLAGPIHVFPKDAPSDAEGGMRFRGGRWKRSLPAAVRCRVADRAILCVLSRGDAVRLTPLARDDAVAALTARPEPGYQFYGQAAMTAARALTEEGAWRLSLSNDPFEAIALIRRHFGVHKGISFHRDYVALINEIEQRFAVVDWKCGDADLWPLARFDLYLDMYGANNHPARPHTRPFVVRLSGRALKPLLNLWRSRRDLKHWLGWPRQAAVIFLGDGVSLDRVERVYQDRQGENLMRALEERGKKTFLMQAGEVVRLPWRRPTFAANVVEAWAWIISPLFARALELPDHREVFAFLSDHGVRAPSLAPEALARRARSILAAAFLFEWILQRVRPKLAVLTSYYAGLGPAFVLACRRRGILSADLQHAPLQGAPMAYVFSIYPEQGYSTLPVLFWSWTQNDANAVRCGPHHSLYGGPPQLVALAAEPSADRPAEFSGVFAREILVALQPISGHRGDWEALAAEIEASPLNWRWWIRRHPASRPAQDVEFGRLLSLHLSRVIIDEASALPLPVLLPRMSVVLSLASGTAMEAALFGVPAVFLSEEARGPFGLFIEEGGASVIGITEVRDRIEKLGDRAACPPRLDWPDLDLSLTELDRLAEEYAAAFSLRDCVNQSPTRCEAQRKPV